MRAKLMNFHRFMKPYGMDIRFIAIQLLKQVVRNPLAPTNRYILFILPQIEYS